MSANFQCSHALATILSLQAQTNIMEHMNDNPRSNHVIDKYTAPELQIPYADRMR